MYLQNIDNIYDLKWNETNFYGDVHKKTEFEYSLYNFELADVAKLRKMV